MTRKTIKNRSLKQRLDALKKDEVLGEGMVDEAFIRLVEELKGQYMLKPCTVI